MEILNAITFGAGHNDQLTMSADQYIITMKKHGGEKGDFCLTIFDREQKRLISTMEEYTGIMAQAAPNVRIQSIWSGMLIVEVSQVKGMYHFGNVRFVFPDKPHEFVLVTQELATINFGEPSEIPSIRSTGFTIVSNAAEQIDPLYEDAEMPNVEMLAYSTAEYLDEAYIEQLGFHRTAKFDLWKELGLRGEEVPRIDLINDLLFGHSQQRDLRRLHSTFNFNEKELQREFWYRVLGVAIPSGCMLLSAWPLWSRIAELWIPITVTSIACAMFCIQMFNLITQNVNNREARQELIHVLVLSGFTPEQSEAIASRTTRIEYAKRLSTECMILSTWAKKYLGSKFAEELNAQTREFVRTALCK